MCKGEHRAQLTIHSGSKLLERGVRAGELCSVCRLWTLMPPIRSPLGEWDSSASCSPVGAWDADHKLGLRKCAGTGGRGCYDVD